MLLGLVWLVVEGGFGRQSDGDLSGQPSSNWSSTAKEMNRVYVSSQVSLYESLRFLFFISLGSFLSLKTLVFCCVSLSLDIVISNLYF